MTNRIEAERQGFLAAIRESPEDETHRLVYADWLQDHDEDAEAEFIRAHIEVTRPGVKSNGSELLRLCDARIAKIVAESGLPEAARHKAEIGFRGGLVDSLGLPARWLVEHADSLSRYTQLLRKLTVYRAHGFLSRLAACPLLGSVTDLRIIAWIAPKDATALAASSFLGRLETLEIMLGTVGEDDNATAEAFGRGAAVGAAYPRLRELIAVDASLAHLAQIDQAAGRSIARAVPETPQLFPIAEDFHPYVFPGLLPDGTQLLVDVNREQLLLYFFDATGRQTELREVPLPAECREQPDDPYGTSHNTARLHEFLRREYGFRPAGIRVLEIEGCDNLYIDAPPGHIRNLLGYLDDPDERPEDGSEYCCGYGAYCYDWVCGDVYRMYLHGGDPYINGRDGGIEST